MLSVEKAPGSSCSCKVSALKTDERDSERLAFPEADPAGHCEKQPTPFSIREYVLASRSKDIGTNWPFPQKNLQLCFRHGIKDLLPPFEPPNLVRARCKRNFIAGVGSLDGKSNSIKSKPSLLADFSNLGSSEQAQIALPGEDKLISIQERNIGDDQLTHGETDIESTVTIHDQVKLSTFPEFIPEIKIVSDASTGLEVAKVPTLSEKVESLHESSDRKWKLIVKLGTISEPSGVEDIASTSSMVSDLMASKVCPVCKAFSSPSNTTLNAHIDQCLFVESSTKRFVTKFSKHKVKPKKKRSMVDIYATAPHCTLEDLDRRNGSNWALDLTLVAPNNDIFTEIKRPKLSLLNPIHDGSEGDVYVDSNGTKLRILSKFNALSPSEAGESCRPGKLAKEIKEGKRFSVEKKNQFSPKYVKNMKVKPQSKKLSSFKPLKDEMTSEGKLLADTHQEKEVCASHILSPQDQIQSTEPGTLRRWVCSKRSGLPKKLNSKVTCKTPGNLAAIPRGLFVDQPNSGNISSERSHIVRLSWPSQKTKSMDCLSKSIHATDHREKDSQVPSENDSGNFMGKNYSTANGLMVKLSRSSGNQVSSLRSKTMEILEEVSRKSGNLLHTSPKSFEGCHHLSQKSKKKSTLIKKAFLGRSSFLRRSSSTSEASRCNEVEKPVITKKLRKHRSLDEAFRSRGKLSSHVNEQFHDCTIDSDLGSERTKQTNKTSYFPENLRRRETQFVNDQISQTLSNIRVSKKQAANDTVPISLRKKVVSVPAIIKDCAARFNGKLDSYPSLEEQEKGTGGTEPRLEASGPGLSDDPIMHCGYEVGDDIHFQNIQMADQSEAKGDLCSELQQTEFQTDTASIQGSSACLTSPGDTCLEVPQVNLSVTSFRTLPAQDDNMETDREASGSPVSVASTISHPLNNRFEPRDLEPEPSEKPVAVQDNSISVFSDNPAVSSAPGTRGTLTVERSQEFKAIQVAQELEKFQDAEPCCCSRREILSRDSPLSAKGKHMTSNLHIRSVSSSFGTYPSSGTEVIPNAVPESLSDSLSTKASSYSAARVTNIGEFGSACPSPWAQPQSSPSPILRLMGKNLMVMSKEGDESVSLQKVVPCSSTDTPNGKHLPRLEFSSMGSISNQDNLASYHNQLLEGPMIMGQCTTNTHQVSLPPPPMQMGGFIDSPLPNSLKTTDIQAHQKKLSKKTSSSFAYQTEKVTFHDRYQKPISASRASKMARDVIVIDDYPKPETDELKGSLLGQPKLPATVLDPYIRQGRPFSCFPSQNSFLLTELSGEPKLGFSISCPMANFNSVVKRGRSSEGSGPLMQSPFRVPSSGHLPPTLYYSQSLR